MGGFSLSHASSFFPATLPPAKGAGFWDRLYLNVVGGFLEGEVRRAEGVPTLTFRHFSVDGKVLNVDVLRAK